MLGVVFMGVVPQEKQQDKAQIKQQQHQDDDQAQAAQGEEGNGEESRSLLGQRNSSSNDASVTTTATSSSTEASKKKPFFITRITTKLVDFFYYSIHDPPHGEENYNPIQVLLSLDFWLFNFVYFAVVGSGLVMFNNLGYLVLSHPSAQNGEQSKFVIILSISNCVGRIMWGWLSDALEKYASRFTFLNIITCLMMYVNNKRKTTKHNSNSVLKSF